MRYRVYRLIALVYTILLVLSITASIQSVYSVEEDIEKTIMLEKAKVSVVLVLCRVYGIISWPEMKQEFQYLGLGEYVEVESGSTGTGFFVSRDGYIVTAGHVVNEYESELYRVIWLLQDFITKYANAYRERMGRDLDLESFSQTVIQAYLDGRLTIKEYTREVYVGVGKVLSGLGNIPKMYTASVVDSLPAEKEDIALLKINLMHTPSLIVPAEDKARVGERVWAVGYPGAATFHDYLSEETIMEPSVTEGTISGYKMKKTGVRVLQADAPVTHGNSGGPLINSRGEVIGVASFISISETGELEGFNFFVPNSIVYQMLQRNSVDNTQDPVVEIFEEGLRLYYNKHYSAAIEKFREAKELFPGLPYVDDYIASAREAILRGEDVPLGPDPFLIAVAVVVIAGGVSGGVLVFLIRRRKKPTPLQSQYPVRQYILPSQEAPYQSTSVASTSQETMTQQVQQVQQVQQPSQQGVPGGVKYCWNCGRAIPFDARLCPYCGVEQEE